MVERPSSPIVKNRSAGGAVLRGFVLFSGMSVIGGPLSQRRKPSVVVTTRCPASSQGQHGGREACVRTGASATHRGARLRNLHFFQARRDDRLQAPNKSQASLALARSTRFQILPWGDPQDSVISFYPLSWLTVKDMLL